MSASPLEVTVAPDRLHPELAAKASARLGVVALGLAAVHLLSLGLDLFNHLLGFTTPTNQPTKNAISVALIVLSAVVALLSRRGSTARSGWIFSGYHLAVALGMELSAQLTPWPAAELVPYQLMRTVSWVALWIVIYPLFVPGPPRRAALTAFAAAAMGPLALGLTVFWGNRWPGLAVAFFVHLPSFLAAILAAISARIVYGLEKRASAERQLGNYVLKRRIAEGGMGEIWEGRHRLLARPAAVKLIPPQKGGDPQARQRRFEREAKATATLASPHTVELYDFGRGADGTFYYVMELLSGMDLEELVRRHGPQPAGRTIHLLQQVCDSLAEAHDKGLLHRDIKPSNIFVCPMGVSLDTIKVLDFGLVRAFGQQERAETRLTKEETLRGTPSYTAPEIAMDEEPIDGRADLYSLGCVAYWLLTGRPPFDRGSALKTLLAQVQDAPDKPSAHGAVPDDLEAVVLHCLAKKAADRPINAQALSRALLACESASSWDADQAEAFWANADPTFEYSRVSKLKH